MGLQSPRRFFMATEADNVICCCPACRRAGPASRLQQRPLGGLGKPHRRSRSPGASGQAAGELGLLGIGEAARAGEAGAEPRDRLRGVVMELAVQQRRGLRPPGQHHGMEEFMGWSLVARGQMGAYDYPGDSMGGMARRFKFYARNGVRFIYANAASGGAPALPHEQPDVGPVPGCRGTGTAVSEGQLRDGRRGYHGIRAAGGGGYRITVH